MPAMSAMSFSLQFEFDIGAKEKLMFRNPGRRAFFNGMMGLVLASSASQAFASFEEWTVPVAVKTLYCDSSPRIVVQFADSAKNIWYPANLGDQSKAFLATAMAAKLSGKNLYYFGSGDASAATVYCISVAARRVEIFGIE
jgi:hypothetical protein